MEIENILEDAGVDFLRESGHHHARSGWIQLDCPFCGPGSGRYHLGFNIAGHYFNCWKCGRINSFKVLRELGIPNPSESLKEISNDQLPSERVKKKGSLVEPKHRGPLLKAHKRYLKSRGFNPSNIQKLWEIEGIGIASRLSWRIYIPIHYKGCRVSWTTRSIKDSGTRYISAGAEEESIPHKSILYGVDYCRQSVVVVEGPLDVWNIGPGAAALFGTAFTQSQIRILSSFPYRTICFDSTSTAQNQAESLASELSCFPGETQIVELEAEDPGTADEKEITKLRKYAKLD